MLLEKLENNRKYYLNSCAVSLSLQSKESHCYQVPWAARGKEIRLLRLYTANL